jgi:hypothetical protein
MNRFLTIILGTATGIDKDLNFIADGEQGVNFVDGKGMFICTFYSPYTASEIHERMAHRPAIMIFDITDSDTFGVNLPTKYFTGIFPEIQKTLDELTPSLPKTENKRMQAVVDETDVTTKVTPKVEVEEYDSVNEILDKLSRNNYDRVCLTEKEIKILNKG